MEVSLELAATEKLGIKFKYGIQTDFVKVVCGSAESRDRLVMDLDHARFTWTQPFLEARKFEMEVEDEDSGDRGRLPYQISISSRCALSTVYVYQHIVQSTHNCLFIPAH